jgi:hypothetical protein
MPIQINLKLETIMEETSLVHAARLECVSTQQPQTQHGQHMNKALKHKNIYQYPTTDEEK